MRKRILLLLVLALSTTLAHSENFSCASALNAPFNRSPDDRRNGLVHVSAPMTIENILTAYDRGIFPWGEAEWYSPPQRGVLFMNELHISHSDRKILKRLLTSGEYEVTDDQDFAGVINGCAEMTRFTFSRDGRKMLAGEWLTPTFITQYKRLFRSGHAHSVEVWHEGKLVGGLYGVFIHGVYSGESMFRLPDHPNVAKLAMLHLLQKLQQKGHSFIDTQMAIGLAGKWGARKIPREHFMDLLEQAHKQNLSY